MPGNSAGMRMLEVIGLSSELLAHHSTRMTLHQKYLEGVSSIVKFAPNKSDTAFTTAHLHYLKCQ